MHLRLSRPCSTTAPWFSFASGCTARHGPCNAWLHDLLSCGAYLLVLLDFIWVAHRTDIDKDVEILLLRQQLRILQRKQPRSPRISRWEKLTLVLFVSKLTTLSTSARARLTQVVLLFKPDTLLKWHRELVRRTWTFKTKTSRGRPSIDPELEALILRLARENPTWGYGKLEGELGKLGYAIGRSTIRDVLKAQAYPASTEAFAARQHLAHVPAALPG